MHEYKHIEQISYQMPENTLKLPQEPSIENNDQEEDLICSETIPDILIRF